MLPHNAPPTVPVAAYFHQSREWLEVIFSRSLTGGPLATTGWLCRAVPFIRNVKNPTADRNAVNSSTTSAGPGPGNWVSYLATPPDLLDDLGRPVAPFLQYPLLVGP